MKQKIDLFDGELHRLCRAEKQLSAAAMDDPANIIFQPARFVEIVWKVLALDIFAEKKWVLIEESILSSYMELELWLALAAEVHFSSGSKRLQCSNQGPYLRTWVWNTDLFSKRGPY